MIWLEYKFKTKGTWLKKVFNIKFTRKKCNIMKCMSQYIRIMSLKMRWVWIWATFGIQTMYHWIGREVTKLLWQNYINGLHNTLVITVSMQWSNCMAKILITLYCNMANQSSFARYVLCHDKYDNWSLLLFGCFCPLKLWSMITKAWYIKENFVELIDHRSYNDYW